MINFYFSRFSILVSFLLFFSSLIQAQNPGITDYADLNMFPSTNIQAEVHISINRQNPTTLVASANTAITSRHTQGRYVSTNGGTSWTGSDELVAGAAFAGDPCTAIDATGNIYISTINYSSNGYSFIKSTNNGTSFGPLTSGGLNTSSFDKDWIAVDDVPNAQYSNNFYATYLIGTSTVGFNRSTNGGTSFSASQTLKSGPALSPIVQTGPSEQVYVCYADLGSSPGTYPANGFGFVRSTDGGTTFTAPRVAVSYVGIQNNSTGVNPTFNNIVVSDFLSMAVDKSNKTFNGRIYVAFAAKQNGNGNDVIQISHSDNQGDTWSAPVLVSLSGAYQCWEPAVCVDQATGNVFVAYSNLLATGNTGRTMLAVSTNGGNTFVNQQASDVVYAVKPITSSYTTFRNGYMGDYIGVAANSGKAYVGWTDSRNGTWQIYVSEVDVVPAIVGPAAFCGSGQFSVTNLPPYLSVSSWSSSPAGVVNISSLGAATKVTQGNATITATLSNGQTVTFNLTTIPQTTTITSALSGSCTNGFQTYSLGATPNMSSATNWHWTVDNSTSGITLNSPYSQNTYADVSKGGGVSVTFSDACGETSQKNGVTIYSPCGQVYTVSPNPASSTVTVAPKSSNNTAVNNSLITEINFFDQQGNRKKHGIFNKAASASINISDLPLGVYVIEIIDSGNHRDKQLLQVIK